MKKTRILSLALAGVLSVSLLAGLRRRWRYR